MDHHDHHQRSNDHGKDQTTTTQTPTVTFTTLPLEIRNIIYDIILSTPDNCLPGRITRDTCDRWEKHPVSGRDIKGPFDVRKLPRWSGVIALRNVSRGIYREVERVVRMKGTRLGLMQTEERVGRAKKGGGVRGRLDVLIAPACGRGELWRDGGGSERGGDDEEMSLLSTWVHLPIPFVWLRNMRVDLRLQSYRPGMFASTMYHKLDCHQVSGTIVKYFIELFCGLLGVDGCARIQPERSWEKLEIRLRFDDDDDDDDDDDKNEGYKDDLCAEETDTNSTQVGGFIVGDEETDGIVERSQRGQWRMEAGSELKYLFDLIHEAGILCGLLQTLSFCDGESTVDWHIQKTELYGEPDEGTPRSGFTDLARVWLAMGCKEMV